MKSYLWAAIGLAAAALLVIAYLAGASAGRAEAEAECSRAERATIDAGRAEQDRGQVASDAAADASKEAERDIIDETRADASTTIETIRYVYRDRPASACPSAPVPDGVREQFAAARAAHAAAARGLRPGVGAGDGH